MKKKKNRIHYLSFFISTSYNIIHFPFFSFVYVELVARAQLFVVTHEDISRGEFVLFGTDGGLVQTSEYAKEQSQISKNKTNEK